MPSRIPRPDWPASIDKSAAHIGKQPSGPYISEPIHANWQYLNNWTQNGQIFSYSGPPDDDMNDSPGTSLATRQVGLFYVILQGSDKADTSNAERHLGGALLPWKYDALWDSGTSAWLGDVQVYWAHDNPAVPVVLYSTYAQSANISSVDYFMEVQGQTPWELYHPDFYYTPDTDYSIGILYTYGIQTAALGLWTMPDPSMTAAQSQFYSTAIHNYMAPGRAIRGYTGTGHPSLGTMIHTIGDTARSDSLNWNSQRCLFQWGHPRGVYTEETSYTEMCTDARYIVRPQNYRERATSTEITVHPLIVAESTGASDVNVAGVKISSYDSTATLIDTWEVEYYDNSTQLYKYSDGTGSDGLNIDLTDTWLKVEFKAPSSGANLIRTIALWQTPEW